MKLICTDTHEYYLESPAGKRRRLLGTTEILQDNGLVNFDGVDSDVLEWARLRGQFIHELTALWDQNDLLLETVDPRLQPYLDAWRKFRKERDFRVTRIEVMGWDKTWGFAGQVDRTASIAWKGRRRPIVLDIKPPGKKKYWKYQLVSYAMIFYPDQVPLRATISLSDEGKYSFDECPEEEFFRDKADWLALNRASQIRMEMAA